MDRIERLNHRDPVVARRIHLVLGLAHAQEAELLQVRHFTPLERSAADIQASTDDHLGALRGDQLLGVVALGPDDEPGQLSVATLVVHPAHQRQGVARALLTHVLQAAPDTVFAVATGARNAPALALYRSLGFVEYRRGSIGPEALPLVKLRRAAAGAKPCRG
ncbi:MAG: GNAT family N-acetyltransferase [Rubrivivax sp.]|nr:GNAT family N-acetyltransferase [Rubrivivax sp.]